MKLYLDYKKQSKIILFVFLFAVFTIFPFVFSSAQTATDLQNKINQKDSEIAKLEEEIRVYQAELDNLGKQKDSLNNTIKELDLTNKKLQTDISVTQNKIDKTNFTIQNLSSDIDNKQGN